MCRSNCRCPIPATVDAVVPISDEVVSCTGNPLTCSKSYKYYTYSRLCIYCLLWEVNFFPYTGHWSASTQRNGPGTSWRMVKHRYKHVAKGITARWFHRSSIKFSSLHKSKAKMLVEDKRMFQQKLKQQMLQQKEKEIEHLQSKQLEYEGLSEV